MLFSLVGAPLAGMAGQTHHLLEHDDQHGKNNAHDDENGGIKRGYFQGCNRNRCHDECSLSYTWVSYAQLPGSMLLLEHGALKVWLENDRWSDDQMIERDGNANQLFHNVELLLANVQDSTLKVTAFLNFIWSFHAQNMWHTLLQSTWFPTISSKTARQITGILVLVRVSRFSPRAEVIIRPYTCRL